LFDLKEGLDTGMAPEYKPISDLSDSNLAYMDVRAEIGMSEHLGGFEFTDVLHQLCHLESANKVLEVGCGIGVGSVYIARRHNCQVTALDISPKMLAWASQRAERARMGKRIQFLQADVRQLPLASASFDAVLVESVLAFVGAKTTALSELIRITRPGGYLGLNEVFWTRQPPAEFSEHAQQVWGSALLSESEWRDLWQSTPFENRVIRTRPMQAGVDLRGRLSWIGWRTVLPAMGRLVRLLLSSPQARASVRQQFNYPPGMLGYLGYGLFVAQKRTT